MSFWKSKWSKQLFARLLMDKSFWTTKYNEESIPTYLWNRPPNEIRSMQERFFCKPFCDDLSDHQLNQIPRKNNTHYCLKFMFSYLTSFVLHFKHLEFGAFNMIRKSGHQKYQKNVESRSVGRERITFEFTKGQTVFVYIIQWEKMLSKEILDTQVL